MAESNTFNQQEIDVLDVMGYSPPLTAGALCKELRWGTAKLHPVLASLEEKGRIKTQREDKYPHRVFYYLPGAL